MSSTDAPPETPIAATAPRGADDGRRVQRSRLGQVWIGGYFTPEVAKVVKILAIEEGVTVQALLGRALNDLLEKHGRGRPASEAVLPRGAAAHRRDPSEG